MTAVSPWASPTPDEAPKTRVSGGWRRSVFGLALAALLVATTCGEEAAAPTSPAPSPPGAAPPPSTPSVPEAVSAWLDANAHPFDHPDLPLLHGDLEFLRDLVGEARVVSLGENTYGTQEFVDAKAAIVRFLVEEMGFDMLVLDAGGPEAGRLDTYVRTGAGDPVRLLSGLYDTNRNSNSFFEMIEWMREHNEAGGAVGVHGIGMLHPGMPIHEVLDYIRAVDPDALEALTEKLDCLTRFANDPRGWFPGGRYHDQDDAYRSRCGASLEEARTMLVENRDEYEAAGGEDAFALALRNHRIAVQYHLWAGGGLLTWDFLAENTVWLRERLGPEGRIVLWAENIHVSTLPQPQSEYQRQAFDDAVVFGFSHGNGRFSAWQPSLSRRREVDLDPPIAGSHEAYLTAATAPRFVLDLREASADAAGSGWLHEFRPFRAIRASYEPDRPEEYWRETRIADWYDAIVHFDATTPIVLLPFVPPSTF